MDKKEKMNVSKAIVPHITGDTAKCMINDMLNTKLNIDLIKECQYVLNQINEVMKSRGE